MGQSPNMRFWMAMLVSMIVFGARAQSHLPGYPFGLRQPLWLTPGFVEGAGPFDHSGNHLQIVPFLSVSAGVTFYNGGISYLSAPVGIALLRPLNNNLTAYGAVSAAPAYFSRSLLYSGPAGHLPYTDDAFELSARIEGGLIYTNDARTFSISGGVSVERGSYPVHYPTAPPKSYRVY